MLTADTWTLGAHRGLIRPACLKRLELADEASQRFQPSRQFVPPRCRSRSLPSLPFASSLTHTDTLYRRPRSTSLEL